MQQSSAGRTVLITGATGALGFTPQWTLEAGWRQTIEQFRREGRL